MRRESWLPAAPEGVARARALVRELSSELRFDGVTTWELMLATSEAFANAVEHGRSCDPRGILLLVEIEDGRVGGEAADCGGACPDRAAAPRRRGEGGRRLRIIAAIRAQREVVPDTGATRVRFAKRLATA